MVPRSTKTLTAEDRILWGKVARTAEPLHGRDVMDRIVEEMMRAQAEQEAKPVSAPVLKPAAPALRPHVPSDPPGFDRPTKRKLEKGRLHVASSGSSLPALSSA